MLSFNYRNGAYVFTIDDKQINVYFIKSNRTEIIPIHWTSSELVTDIGNFSSLQQYLAKKDRIYYCPIDISFVKVDYFHWNLERVEAESLLSNPNTFLFRFSQSNEYFTLTYNTSDKVLHSRVQVKPDGYYHNSKIFNDVDEIIAYFEKKNLVPVVSKTRCLVKKTERTRTNSVVSTRGGLEAPENYDMYNTYMDSDTNPLIMSESFPSMAFPGVVLDGFPPVSEPSNDVFPLTDSFNSTDSFPVTSDTTQNQQDTTIPSVVDPSSLQSIDISMHHNTDVVSLDSFPDVYNTESSPSTQDIVDQPTKASSHEVSIVEDSKPIENKSIQTNNTTMSFETIKIESSGIIDTLNDDSSRDTISSKLPPKFVQPKNGFRPFVKGKKPTINPPLPAPKKAIYNRIKYFEDGTGSQKDTTDQLTENSSVQPSPNSKAMPITTVPTTPIPDMDKPIGFRFEATVNSKDNIISSKEEPPLPKEQSIAPNRSITWLGDKFLDTIRTLSDDDIEELKTLKTTSENLKTVFDIIQLYISAANTYEPIQK